MHGRGTKTWINGNKYVGDWFNDSITGNGTFMWPDGTKYEGQYNDGKKHGHGTQKWSNGDKYTGDWVNATITGKGNNTWSNGDEYVGDWVNARKILSSLPRSSTDHAVTSLKQLRNVFTSTNRSTGAIIQSILLEEPNPPCIQCSDIEEPVRVGINMLLFTLYSLYERLIHKDKYIIVDGQVIDEIKQSLKRKLPEDDDDDYQNESDIVKKTKKLSTTHYEHNKNFVMLVDDQIPTHTNGHHAHQKIIYKLVMTVALQTIAIVVDSITLTLLVLLILIFIYYVYNLRTNNIFRRIGMTGPAPIPFLGEMFNVIRRGMYKNDVALVKKYGKIVGIYEGTVPIILVTDLDILRNVLIKDSHVFINRRTIEGAAGPFEHGLTVLKDEQWKNARSIISPTFSTAKLKATHSLMNDVSDMYNERLLEYADKQEIFDIKTINGQHTLDNIASCLFGIETNSLKNENITLINHLRKFFTFSLANIFLLVILLSPRLAGYLGKRGYSILPT
ncbi:unnamed protein product [Adineta steineri]|uniref:Uncharacterized protein n=1 Tax=Adineta steineri TaxID=433720 RepID=A0A815RZ67_9BILA|nr:unnamed protein product [Adineta steineri]CAF1483887.1 unnamed protein product [Adineta steineri]